MQDEEIRCIGTKNKNLDVTAQLQNIGDDQVKWQSTISGYILKKNSPSCGMERVKVYSGSMPDRNGTGIYAKKLMDNFPNLPVEEEGRLNDSILRENFIQRVFFYERWQSLTLKKYSLNDIQRFHAQHKYIYMSHDQLALKQLGAILAKPCTNISLLAETYLSQAMTLLKSKTTKSNHTHTLQHIQSYLKKHMDQDDRQELCQTIEQYKNGYVPLIVPITLLRHHFRKYPNDYITDSFYLCPHPSELMLLNNV